MVSSHIIPDKAGVGGLPVSDRGMIGPEHGAPDDMRTTLHTGSFVSWGAIIGGMLLTVALMILSNTLAFACGVPAFRGGEYGWGAGIWSVLTAVIAFYFGGWLTGCLMADTDARHTSLSGLLTWALTLPLLYLLFNTTLLVGFLGRAAMSMDAAHMTIPGTTPPATGLAGPAWGTVISLTLGLLAAMAGGLSGSPYKLTNIRTILPLVTKRT